MTGTRADYGLLYWLMRDLDAHPDYRLQVMASAMHLAPAFGETVRFLREDGLDISATVPCLDEEDDSDMAMVRNMAKALVGFAAALESLQPDLLVVLGDRFEALAATQAAAILHIPVAHLHGGEVTLGAIDEQFRHAITKFAHLHFTAAEAYRRRVIQLGEAPERVFMVGAVGLDNFKRLELPTRAALEGDLSLSSDQTFILATFHPATQEPGKAQVALEELLNALDRFPELTVVFTKANADPSGRAINARLDAYAEQHANRVRLVASLGQKRYLAAMRHAAVVVGNSSSGIIEAPAVDVPVVNIGSRQEGRLRAVGIIDVPAHETAISDAIARALTPHFRREMKRHEPPYGRPGDATGQIIDVLDNTDFGALSPKAFHDVPAAGEAR